jgi:hypothetical protein
MNWPAPSKGTGTRRPDGSRSSRSSDADGADEAILLSDGVEEKLQLTADDLAALLAVEAVKGFGPQKFRELHESGVTAAEVIASPSRLPTKGSRWLKISIRSVTRPDSA